MIGTILALACAGTSARAGEVEVTFIEPGRYADIGFESVVRQRNLRTLEEHIRAWSARLAPAQKLQIEVLNVDLAGIERPIGRHPFVRVLGGRADGPHITLRWTLREDERVTAQAQEELSDMAYADRIRMGLPNEPLHVERRMLDAWLQSRILPPAAAR